MTWRGNLVVCPRCNYMNAETMEEEDDGNAVLLCECLSCGHQWDIVEKLAPPPEQP